MDSLEAKHAAKKEGESDGEIGEEDKPKPLGADFRKDSVRADSADAEEIENYKSRNGATHRIAADSVLAEIQTEADRAATAWGKSAVQPWDAEGITAYRRRVAREHQQHSPAWKGVDLRTLRVSPFATRARRYSRTRIAASSAPESYPDTLIERHVRDPISGQKRIEFYGTPARLDEPIQGRGNARDGVQNRRLAARLISIPSGNFDAP